MAQSDDKCKACGHIRFCHVVKCIRVGCTCEAFVEEPLIVALDKLTIGVDVTELFKP